jgi:fibronectin type 3 domain-containing protein
VPAVQTLHPVADTFVKKDDTSSHGSEDRLLAKHSNGSSRRETFLKFSLSSITQPVTEATLRLRSFTSSSWPNATTVVVREFTSSSWNESINWNTRPSDSALGSVLASLAVPQFTEFWWEVDVTDYVEARRQAGATEVTFAIRGTANTNGGLEMWSRESATPPELVVAAFEDASPPAAPSGLSASAQSASQVTVDWADNGEPDLDGYHVYRSTESGFAPGPSNRVAAGLGSSQFVDTGLGDSTTYFYRVTAVDEAANESPASVEVSATTDAPDATPPGAPSGVSATGVSSAQIDLDWQNNGESDLAGYAVYRSAQAGFTPDATNRIASGLGASQFSDSGLASATTYYYRVTASDDSGNESAPSAEVSATTGAAPATQTLNPVADTYVKQSDTSSHGSEDRLLVKLTGGSSTRHTYIKFDTSAIEGSVSQVTLRLSAFTQVSSWPSSVTVQLREFTNSSWAESIHWNNRPPDSALGSVLGTIQAPVDPPQWWEIDVSAYVVAQRAAGNGVVSFAVRSANSGNGGIEIWSRESSNPPELVVEVD